MGSKSTVNKREAVNRQCTGYSQGKKGRTVWLSTNSDFFCFIDSL